MESKFKFGKKEEKVLKNTLKYICNDCPCSASNSAKCDKKTCQVKRCFDIIEKVKIEIGKRSTTTALKTR